MLSLMPRAEHLDLWFCTVSSEKLQSRLVVKGFKSYAAAMGRVQSLAVNPLTDFVLHGMESGLQNDQYLKTNLS